MPKPWENAEGYADPTAYHGTQPLIQEAEEESRRLAMVISVIKSVTSLGGFEMLNRVELRDRRSGRVYK